MPCHLRSAGRMPLRANAILALLVLTCVYPADQSHVRGSARKHGAGPQCPKPRVVMAKRHYQCTHWTRVCLDHSTIVSYDPRVHPKTSMGTLPTLNLSDPIIYNLPSKDGIGDRYVRGTSLQVPVPYVRPSNDMEEAPDLEDPHFSPCTLPLLLYASYPFNSDETFVNVFDKLLALQEAGFFNRHVTLVPGVPPGTRLPEYTKFWLRTLSDLEPVSLSRLSARRPPDSPSNATSEGRHVRCFRHVVACRLWADGLGCRFHHAGQHVVRHYLPQLLARSAEFEDRLFHTRQVRLPPVDDPSVFKLVFVSRSPRQSALGRSILNEAEMTQRCNAATGADTPPAAWGVPYKRFFCFAHEFGKDNLMDVWIMRRVDAILGIHGAGLINSVYMKRGGSVVEVRPYGFAGNQSWANGYARAESSTPAERPWPKFWYGIDTFNASLSEPGAFEKEDKPHYTPHINVKARDRHVRLTWPSLRHQLLNMAAVARTHDRYMALRLSGAFYVTDGVQQAEPPGLDREVDRWEQRRFTDPDEERTQAVLKPLDQAALDGAATLDALDDAAVGSDGGKAWNDGVP